MPRREQAATKPAGSLHANPDDELTLDEIIDRHWDRWVVMRVTAHDEDHWPWKGFVLVSAATQDESLTQLEQLSESQRKMMPGNHPLYAFHAYPDIKAGPEFEAFLRELLSTAESPA